MHLIPMPQSVKELPGRFVLPAEMNLVLCGEVPARRLFAAERFMQEAESLTPSRFALSAGPSIAPVREISVTQDPALFPELPAEIRKQAYRLLISKEGIHLSASGEAGIFYAFQTLLQILRETACAGASKNRKSKIENRKSPSLPCVEILDHPDFPRRGFYHDTARGKVPTVETLLQLIDDLAHLKYNEFQLYIENNFAFRRYPEMYDDTTPLTAEELLQLDAACRIRHVDFVPSLTSLGHFEKILARPKFCHLAEAQPAQLKAMNATCWHEAGPWSLAVADPQARAFLKNMYDEFAPNFSSGLFNICCDEAYDLGTVRSKKLAEERGGTGQLYVDWINYCAGLARNHGKAIQMWGDIILNHPDLIEKLPEDATLLEWGYEHDHKFEAHCKVFAERLGLPRKPGQPGGKNFYVAPGTTSWLSLSSRSKNAFGNIHSAATNGLKFGASGLLLTDWGDNGHQQPLAVSYCAIAYGAAASWNLAATPDPYDAQLKKSKIESLLTAISWHLFHDPAGKLATLAYDLGLTYERFSWQRFNGSLDWFLFREKWDFANYVNRAEDADLPKVIAATEKILESLGQATAHRTDGPYLIAELLFSGLLIIHACKRTALRKAWLAADPAKRNPEHEVLRAKPPRPLPKTFNRDMQNLRNDARSLRQIFEQLWLARNKPSRLTDVLAEFDRLDREYQHFAISEKKPTKPPAARRRPRRN